MTKAPMNAAAQADSPVKPLSVVPDPTDRKLRALALGVEFTKRCVEARTVDELFLMLTNDCGAVVEFDRALLLLHLKGSTELAAANNTPTLDKRARFHEEATALGEALRATDRGMLLSGNLDAEVLRKNGLDNQRINALRDYLEFAQSTFLFSIPLMDGGRPMAHLVLEFFPGRAPDETRLMVLLNMAPILASVLAKKWLLARRPGLEVLLGKPRSLVAKLARWGGRLAAVAALAAAMYGLMFRVPVPVQVGGEAEIGVRVRHTAFCQNAGLVAKVLVSEGAAVQAGQTVATIDSREIDFKIQNVERQIELLGSEMEYLQRQAAHGTVAKLAEREQVDLKRRSAQADLEFLRWERQFLEIKAPVAGTVITRDVEGLAGKKLQAGEPFCEVLASGDLTAEVLVPEERISLVKVGQPLSLYLDTDPRTALPVAVEEIAPKAEVTPRLGAVFRVRGRFTTPGVQAMPGMKGIGKIQVSTSTAWEVVRERFTRAWRRWSLYFS